MDNKELDKLEALAKAATPQNFDSAQITNQGCIECPSCDGSGEVELTADYCNYDGRAIGVQFYGIGPEHRAAEAFYRAANPAAILELIALARVGSAAPAAPTAEQIANVILRLIGECAMDWRAGPTGNDEDDAFSSDDEELRVLVGLVNKALTAPTAAEGLSTDADAYMYACDLMEQFQKERATRGVDVGTQGSLCDGIAWVYDRLKKLETAAPLPTKEGAGEVDAMSQAALDVLAERRRQVEQEGWTLERDDEYTDYSMPRAAAAYAIAAAVDQADRAVLDDFGNSGLTHEIKRLWPVSWSLDWLKPKGRRADLIKSGALILAEIERLDRAAQPKDTTDTGRDA